MTAHKNSNNARLLTLDIGERVYIEVSPDNWANKMRSLNTPRSRRPEIMRHMDFTASLFTAVPASKVGEAVRYLICIERVK